MVQCRQSFFRHMPVFMIGSNIIAHTSVQNWHRGKIPPLSKRSNLTIYNARSYISIICFKVADIVRDNQAKNSKYGQK